MAEKKDPNVFGGFEALASELLHMDGNPDDGIPEVDPEEIEEEAEEEEQEEEQEEELTEDEKLELEKDEPEEEEEEESDDLDNLDTLGDYETPLTKLVQEQMFDELGWELEDDDQVGNIKELVDYMKKTVEEASKPQYANEELARLDSFIKQGGKLEDYFQKTPGGTLDLEDIDLSDENMQKSVVKELLTNVRGYKEDRVNRTIKRYDEGGILEEEAEEAAELLKEYKTVQQEKLLKDQELYSKQAVQQQQKFYSDVEESVKALKEIRGISISGKDKNELLDYMFKPGPNGRTKYQTDYMSSVGNFIESAFFTKDKDKNTLVNKAKKSAKSEAVKEIHQKIKASKGKRQKSSGSQGGGGSSDMMSLIGKSLIKKV